MIFVLSHICGPIAANVAINDWLRVIRRRIITFD
jgi:hypothetical protein